MATTINEVPEYTGTAPNRTQSQSEFNTNTADWVEYTADNLAPGINVTVAQMNAANAETEANRAAAEAAADEAAASADAAAGFANAAPWEDSPTVYDEYDAVIGSDYHTYVCTADGTVGDDPVGSTTGKWVRRTVDPNEVLALILEHKGL